MVEVVLQMRYLIFVFANVGKTAVFALFGDEVYDFLWSQHVYGSFEEDLVIFLWSIVLTEEVRRLVKLSILLTLNKLEDLVDSTRDEATFRTLATLQCVRLSASRWSKKKDSSILTFDEIVNYWLKIL